MPVVSLRDDGLYYVVDGQHRIRALQQAGHNEKQILCEVQEGLTEKEEAALFLKLNNGRKAVAAYDKWKAELVARDPSALEIQKIVSAAGLRVTKAPGKNNICAVNALRSVHHSKKNLPSVLSVLSNWAEEDTSLYEGQLIKAMAEFLALYPNADRKLLVKKLQPLSPESVLSRINRQTSKADRIPFRDAAAIIIREIYNRGCRDKLMPLHRVREEEAA